MQKKGVILKIFIIFIIFFSTLNISFAKGDINPKIEKVFKNFVVKLEKKYDNKKEIWFLERINLKIKYLLEKRKISEEKKKILLDIIALSNEEIFKIKSVESLENISQKYLEANILNKLKKDLDKIEWENFIKYMWKKIYKVSDKQEFVENNSIKRILFSKYFKLTSKNYKQLKSKKWIIVVYKNWESWLVEDYTIEEKSAYSDSTKYFENYITYDKKYFLEKSSFYSYNFQKYTFFEDNYGFYKSDLLKNKIDKNNVILYFAKNKKYNFIKNYKKIKLINSDIIYWIVDKKDFLNDLINDKLYLTEDTDYLFIKLKSEIEKLTKNKTKSEKIKIIYNFILNKLEYIKNLDVNDKKIFSGILSYKNKSWVCEWYVKLMSYALKFAWIKDARVIRWDVIDAKDFPKIWHAWIKIWEKYYDPTFDDPIWISKNKSYSEYKYFWIPRDLLYANRFDNWTLPKKLEKTPLNFRINLINQNLSKLVVKYKNSNYKILEWVKFNKKNNITIWKNITIEESKKIIPYFVVTEKSSWELFFYKNWIKKNITKIQYYIVNDKNISQVFNQLNYNLEWLYLFKWNDKSWNISYRIWFNVEIK